LICFEGASEEDALVHLAKTLNASQKILVIVGPEGGISPQELAFLQSKGGIICSLGKRIVRSETAALVVLSYLNTLWEC
jgi:16S rRNA (uracil1498-N3)-methyltransferase